MIDCNAGTRDDLSRWSSPRALKLGTNPCSIPELGIGRRPGAAGSSAVTSYGIFHLDSGNAFAWFESQGEAIEVVRRIISNDPDSLELVGLMEFDETGHPMRSLHGQDLASVVGARQPAPTI